MKNILGFTMLLFSCVVMGAEPVAKEDTTPPPPEGALTIDQIPPVSSIENVQLPRQTPPSQVPTGLPPQSLPQQAPVNPQQVNPTVPTNVSPQAAPTSSPGSVPAATPSGTTPLSMGNSSSSQVTFGRHEPDGIPDSEILNIE